MFIQVIQGRCRDADRLRELLDEWTETRGQQVPGWLGGTYGVTDDSTAVAVVRFESREAAMANSGDPEQDAWWQRVEECFDGEVTFHDYDDVLVMLDGGSDDAGFVQVIQGRVADVERYRAFITQPLDFLRAARPEIIGATVGLGPDRHFTQTVAFTTEAEARAAEGQQMPEDVQATMDEEMSQLEDVTFLDLRRPWFATGPG